jgi:hypothetical protein
MQRPHLKAKASPYFYRIAPHHILEYSVAVFSKSFSEHWNFARTARSAGIFLSVPARQPLFD